MCLCSGSGGVCCITGRNYSYSIIGEVSVATRAEVKLVNFIIFVWIPGNTSTVGCTNLSILSAECATMFMAGLAVYGLKLGTISVQSELIGCGLSSQERITPRDASLIKENCALMRVTTQAER